MNKTTSINLGGYFFHIDEDAFRKLSNYFEAVRRSLSPDGREEIIKDIESRISEIFSEKLGTTKQVIGLKEVDEVIAIMGQPEDYKIEEETPKNEYYSNYSSAGTTTKKLYRDKENSLLGGVMSGLGHYFGVDPLWLRIIMVVLFFGFGTGLVLYFILWVLVPEAITTSQKLEMKGQPITISNIEKKVKEGFSEISEKFSNLDHDKIANNARNGAQQISSTLSDLITSAFKVFSKLIGGFIVFFSSMSLLSIIIGGIAMMFFSTLPDNLIYNKIHTPFDIETPIWLQGILFIVVAGIPLLFFLILGLKLLSNRVKSFGATVNYSLLGVWIISLAAVIFLTVKEISQNAYTGKDIKKELIKLQPTDTLNIKFQANNVYSKDMDQYESFEVIHDDKNNAIFYSNDITIRILETEEPTAYLQIEKTAEGNSIKNAKLTAEKIKYNFKIENNNLILDNYWITELANKKHDQEVELYLYLPKGVQFKVDDNYERFDSSDNDFFNLHYSSDKYVYKVGEYRVLCTNCPNDENEYDDLENDSISNSEENSEIILNEDGVLIKKGNKTVEKQNVESIKINKDGVIIKSN